MTTHSTDYPVKFDIAYPETVDRFTSFVRLLWAVPVLILLCLLVSNSGGAGDGLFVATALMVVFRQSYPRWWFDFALELNRFAARVSAYALLLTDRYPSATARQTVRLEIPYPQVKTQLNRWLPLVKWLLALPHYIVLVFLSIGVVFVTIAAWVAILFTGRYPKPLFTYVVGVGRWYTRVNAYAYLLVTDIYPPFSLRG